MKRSPQVEVVRVSPALADRLAAEEAQGLQARTDQALRLLAGPTRPQPFTLVPGTALKVTLWSFPPQLAATAPAPTALGSYVVSEKGEILLPYVGAVQISGLTLRQAQDVIGARYRALRMFQAPSVAIEAGSSPESQIIVTGAVGQPKVLAWPVQGMTLAEAVTQSLGDGAALLSVAEGSSDADPAVRVALVRDGIGTVELPVSAALEQRIALRPGDRIIVRKSPQVRVTVLGAGVKSNGLLGFAEPPPLVRVLARASGLEGNIANSHAVFVLRRPPGGRPVLYDFGWDRAEGLLAARRFPIEDGDLVYVAEAPIVPIQRVIGILYQLALPAQTLK